MVSAPESVIGPGAGSHLLADVSSESDCTYDPEPFDELRGSMSFLDLATGEIEVLAEEDGAVLSTPDGSRLVIEGEDSDEELISRVVDRPSGDEVAVLPGVPRRNQRRRDDRPHRFQRWDCYLGCFSRSTRGAAGDATAFSLGSWLSPDGSTVARLNGPAVDLIDSRTGEVEQVLRTGLGSNGDVSFSDDGSRVAVNGDEEDGRIRSEP